MIDLQIDNPMPMPCAFVVTNGVNMFDATLASNPGPESATVRKTVPVGPMCVSMLRVLAHEFVPVMASMALLIRLRMTC